VVLVVVAHLTIHPQITQVELATEIHSQELLAIHHQTVGVMMVEMDHMEVRIMVLVVAAVAVAQVAAAHLSILLKKVMVVLDTMFLLRSEILHLHYNLDLLVLLTG
tara:strand:- start:251 stop:568 length:318 start_codon:yes stop_codon:yes gene_type:complete